MTRRYYNNMGITTAQITMVCGGNGEKKNQLPHNNRSGNEPLLAKPECNATNAKKGLKNLSSMYFLTEY